MCAFYQLNEKISSYSDRKFNFESIVRQSGGCSNYGTIALLTLKFLFLFIIFLNIYISSHTVSTVAQITNHIYRLSDQQQL